MYSVLSLSEDLSPYADEGRAFIDGNMPIVCHTHRQLVERGGGSRREKTVTCHLEELSCTMEVAANTCRVVCVGGHSHNASQLNAFELLPDPAIEIVHGLIGRETELALFLSYMKL